MSTGGSASATWSTVATLASTVEASLDRWLVDTHRIGLTEFRALSHLSLAPNKELRVNDLAQRIGLNPSSTTRLVTRLESKGFVQRDICVDDGRGVYAVISRHGEGLLLEAHTAYEARVRDLLGNLASHFPHLDAQDATVALAQVRDLLGRL